MNHSNLKKHLTLSALFVAGTMLSYTAHAEDVSNGDELATIIAESGERTGTLTTNITASENLGELVGTQLTIDGGENKYGISGSYGTEKHYEGITVDSEKKLFINNVGSVDDTTGNIINSWNGFARNVTAANAYADAFGGAIYNYLGTVEISNSIFSNNSATASATTDAYAYADGGAIYNGSGTVNIIASTKDSVFSGNKTITNDIEAKNDIYNYSGTINLYAASGKTISFDGGIESEGDSSSVKINVQGETGTYTDNDVAGTVLFETGSINSGNNFTLGAGTLKLENDVTWTNNTLAMNGGTLDIGSSTESEIGRLNYHGGSLTLNAGANINIDISETGHDQIVFSNSAQFILNGGKITVDLNKSVSVGDKFEILKVFILGGSNQDLSTLVVEVANAPDYILAASIIEEEDGSTNSLLLTVAAIPEPSMFGLFAGFAALALVGTRRRRK